MGDESLARSYPAQGRIVAVGRWRWLGTEQRAENVYRPRTSALSAALDVFEATDHGVFALPRRWHLPSTAIVPALEEEVARISSPPSSVADCGHFVRDDELGVLRLGADMTRTVVFCPSCARVPVPGLPSGCFVCHEADAYGMAVMHDRGRLMALINLCPRCTEQELEDDPEQLQWAVVTSVRRWSDQDNCERRPARRSWMRF